MLPMLSVLIIATSCMVRFRKNSGSNYILSTCVALPVECLTSILKVACPSDYKTYAFMYCYSRAKIKCFDFRDY